MEGNTRPRRRLFDTIRKLSLSHNDRAHNTIGLQAPRSGRTFHSPSPVDFSGVDLKVAIQHDSWPMNDTETTAMNETTTIVRRHKVTVEDFHKMGAAGILGASERIELIDGELIDMAPIGTRHAYVVDHLIRLMIRRAGDDKLVRVQNPIQLGHYGEPEPDIVLVRDQDYSAMHPGPDDVLLLIEVADTTVEYDRGVKVPLYARFNIPEVWLVNIERRCVEVYRQPDSDHGIYKRIIEVATGMLVPENVSELNIDVSALWPTRLSV